MNKNLLLAAAVAGLIAGTATQANAKHKEGHNDGAKAEKNCCKGKDPSKCKDHGKNGCGKNGCGSKEKTEESAGTGAGAPGESK